MLDIAGELVVEIALFYVETRGAGTKIPGRL